MKVNLNSYKMECILTQTGASLLSQGDDRLKPGQVTRATPDRFGKAVASQAASIVGKMQLIPLMEKVELFARTLQSKGVDTSLADQIRSVSRVLPNEGAVVFDVGANVGNWTRELLKQCSSKIAQVHCFEPAAVNIEKIKAIGDRRVIIHPFAAGSVEEEREFFSDSAGSGIASFFGRGHPLAPEMSLVNKVTVRPLDQIVKEQGITTIDLLKMDIEGAEMEALQGLSGTFGANIVKAFTFEIGSVNIASKTYLSDFFRFCEVHRYSIYRLTAGGGLYKFKSYRVSHECFATTNYLAVAERS